MLKTIIIFTKIYDKTFATPIKMCVQTNHMVEKCKKYMKVILLVRHIIAKPNDNYKG